MVVVAGLAAAALWSNASQAALAMWLGAITVVAATRLVLHAAWVRFGERKSVGFWFRLFITGAFLSGVVWGSAGGVYVLRLDALESHVALILALAGISAAAVLSCSNDVRLLRVRDSRADAADGVCACQWRCPFQESGVSTLLFLIGMIIIARRNNATIMEALELRDRNHGLVETLRSTNTGLQSTLALLEGALNSTAHGSARPGHERPHGDLEPPIPGDVEDP